MSGNTRHTANCRSEMTVSYTDLYKLTIFVEKPVETAKCRVAGSRASSAYSNRLSVFKKQLKRFAVDYKLDKLWPLTKLSISSHEDSGKYDLQKICGKTVQRKPKIVGGEEATPREFPWLVSCLVNHRE